jgi:hypothetical protein
MQPSLDAESEYDLARGAVQREVHRYYTRIRMRERQISGERDDDIKAAMRLRLDRYKTTAGKLLGRLWQQVEAMRLMERPPMPPTDFARFSTATARTVPTHDRPAEFASSRRRALSGPG